jgi:hypothetical protein
MQIYQWSELSAHFRDGLILGNGASMAIHNGFSYDSLFQAAQENGHVTADVANVFRAFGVVDFELVLRRLWQAKVVNGTLDIPAGPVETAYAQVRDALIATVRDVHITHADALVHLNPIYTFMSGFRTVVSLNYDLIVYWAAMQSQNNLGNWFKDCFVNFEFVDNWKAMREPYRAQGSTLYFYPHGNLSLARGLDDGEYKLFSPYTDLLTHVLNVWQSGNAVPLFVSEGTSDHKLSSIKSSNYLQRVNREVLSHIGDSLVVYGWGVGEQEQHILSRLGQSRCRRVAVSVRNANAAYMRHAEDSFRSIGMQEVVFFDSASPGCWHNPLA